MKRWIALAATLAVITVVAACAQPEQTYEEPAEEMAAETMAPSPEEGMDDLAIAWDTGMASGDPEAMLALYVDEGAAIMAPDQPTVVGKEAMRGFFEQFFAMGEVEVQDIPQEVVAGDTHMAGKGTYVFTQTNAEGETLEDSGSWLSVAVRAEDGSWKMVRNIWNRNKPLPGAPEPPPIAEAGPEPAADAACYDSPTALDQGFEAELEAGNVAALVAAHTPDGSRIPPDMPELKGHAQVAAYFASRMEPFSQRVLDLTEIVEMVDGDLGVTLGNFAFDYTFADGSGNVTDQGKYMAVSKKGDDGCWRLHWVLWNSNEPVAG